MAPAAVPRTRSQRWVNATLHACVFCLLSACVVVSDLPGTSSSLLVSEYFLELHLRCFCLAIDASVFPARFPPVSALLWSAFFVLPTSKAFGRTVSSVFRSVDCKSQG